MSWFSKHLSSLTQGVKVIGWIMNPTPDNIRKLVTFIIGATVNPEAVIVGLAADLIMQIDLPDDTIVKKVVAEVVECRGATGKSRDQATYHLIKMLNLD